MHRGQATYEAFDGVEIPLRDGRVVKAKALTVEEAVRYLRLLDPDSEGEPEHVEFVETFPGRIGLTDVALANVVGFEFGDLDVGEMTVGGGLELARMFDRAVQSPATDEGMRNAAKAQLDLLNRAPAALGLGTGASVQATLGAARRFTEAFYLGLYGLAMGFYHSHVGSPPTEASQNPGSEPSTGDPSQGLTT